MEKRDQIKQMAEWIKEKRGMVVFSGAGMSTESGIPDYRSKQGLWNNIDPTVMASIDTLEENYDLCYEFYKARMESLRSCTPHEGYRVLKRLEDAGYLDAIVTQNVDGFHIKSGNKTVYELHGTYGEFKCNSCGSLVDVELFLKKEKCPHCGSRVLRPNVVLFGEMLPQREWNLALRAVENAEILLVMGTSLTVSPANQIPYLCKGKKIYVNRERSGQEHLFDLFLEGSCKETLLMLEEELFSS